MKVFLTSASGYVGAEIAKVLQAEGHTVVGLARSDESANKLRSNGIEPVMGNLQQLEVLAQTAASADAVIHTAFDHSGVDFENAIRMDRSAIQTMTAAMAGTNKPFVMSSGTGLLGSTGPAPANEEFPIDPEIHLRHRVSSERDALAAAGKGVRTAVIRLPMFVWGNGGSVFICTQLATARKLGKAYYLLPGDQMTSGVHVEDAARAYVLALKHAPAASMYHIVSSNDTTMKSIAEAVGANLGVPIEPISIEEALQNEVWPAWMALAWTYNNRASFEKAQKELKWGNFKEFDMLTDVRSGSYK